MTIEFKYQTLFSCTVPPGYTAIKNFYERIATDERLTEDKLSDIIMTSFNEAKIAIERLEMSADLTYCDVLIQGESIPLRVSIRSKPSLVVDGTIYKLEEFDI